MRRMFEVSVLFSEPKIPQFKGRRRFDSFGFSFSALQRAENSSILERVARVQVVELVSVLFSEPKIPQCPVSTTARASTRTFQCSSASRKFLNRGGNKAVVLRSTSFSALQRAENSSIGLSLLQQGPAR